MKTGNTRIGSSVSSRLYWPQWSPVMKTGNTRAGMPWSCPLDDASMEPGHEDREYLPRRHGLQVVTGASMEPGHEDREYGADRPRIDDGMSVDRLNGARS